MSKCRRRILNLSSELVRGFLCDVKKVCFFSSVCQQTSNVYNMVIYNIIGLNNLTEVNKQ